MSIHLHRMRQITGWVLGAIALSPFALCFATLESSPEAPALSPVTGRLTIAGQPAGQVFICLDQGDQHEAFACSRDDGTFHLGSMRWYEGGARPGHYRAHLFTIDKARTIPPKYLDPRTSDLDLKVHGEWNDFRINLP